MLHLSSRFVPQDRLQLPTLAGPHRDSHSAPVVASVNSLIPSISPHLRLPTVQQPGQLSQVMVFADVVVMLCTTPVSVHTDVHLIPNVPSHLGVALFSPILRR